MFLKPVRVPDTDDDTFRLFFAGLSDGIFFQFVVEGAAADSQLLCGELFIPTGFLENIQQQFSFAAHDRRSADLVSV